MQPNQSQQPQQANPYQQYSQPTKKNNKKLVLVVAGLILGIILASIIFFVFTQEDDSTATFTAFEDPNFTMQIPESWSGDASYEPGSSLIMYYSPEDSSDENREKASRLIVYVGSQENRIDTQIDELESSGAKYSIITDETTENNGTQIRYVELVVTPIETPEKETRVASATAKKGNFIINADMQALNTHWGLHEDVARKTLKSISPACDDPKLELFNTQSAVDVCE